MNGIGIRGVSKGSRLVLLGDWYFKPGQGWFVVCYFFNQEGKPYRQSFPVDLLPGLIPGMTYPASINQYETSGYTGTFKVPDMSEWKKYRYRELPRSLKRLREYSEQIDQQVVYFFEVGNKGYWLPVTELARMLFFHSAEVTRAAIYQGNTWQLAKVEKNDWVGEVRLTSEVPVGYLNSFQFRKFFTWLFFSKDAEKSFCSIFKLLNEESYLLDNHDERWTFDCSLPNIENCEISWSGYTGRAEFGESHHNYIREIRSVSGIAVPKLDAVYFSHTNDSLVLSEKPGGIEAGEKGRPGLNICPEEIDADLSPRASGKKYLLKITSSGFYFDTEIALKRNPPSIRTLSKAESPENHELSEEKMLGLTEANDHGELPRSDINSLDAAELLDGPEKLNFFEMMLQKLKVEYGWSVKTQTGTVPKKNCRKVHLIDGRRRKYCHALLCRDETTSIQILEIELTQQESLSTLFFRADVNSEPTEQILDALMSTDNIKGLKAMQWKRELIAEVTSSRLYLDHPDRKIKSEEDALFSWVARAAEKLRVL
ncbi:Tn7-like element transposition protein TnsE [Endozoicomonas acroporae]|uniref:Tn7-like element transposition protein TnsE n=1 Tax=Endozoicomonas acroporae TaxID=1701104 RepID=UPI000C77EE5F|nr:hypothetical protein [Endozoicomonas acroporae]